MTLTTQIPYDAALQLAAEDAEVDGGLGIIGTSFLLPNRVGQ